MMDILMSETFWAHKKWNKIASDIKLDFHSSTITMMHGPINIRWTCNFVRLILVGKSRNNLRQNQKQCHIVEHKSRLDWPGVRPRPPRSDAGAQPSKTWHGFGEAGLCGDGCIVVELWAVCLVWCRACVSPSGFVHKLSTWRWGHDCRQSQWWEKPEEVPSNLMMAAGGLLKVCGKT